jgi:hypothetical protein
LTHPAWSPKDEECGGGKYHAVFEPGYADQYRGKADDRYVAIWIAVKDLYTWPTNPDYPGKIAFREGKVMYECDRDGKQIVQ